MTANPTFASIMRPQTQTAPKPAAPIRMLPKVEVSKSISFLTLVKMELRKAFDTRAGRVLFMVMIGLSLGATAIGVALFKTLAEGLQSNNWQLMAALPGWPISILMPVIAILLFTSEWGQRTALTTFALEPRRGRVIAAKMVVGVLLGVISFLIQQVIVAIGAALAGQVHNLTIDWSITWKSMGLSVIILMSSVLMAMGFALLLMNAPAAIILVNVLPMLFSATVMLPQKWAELASWINPSSIPIPFGVGDTTATMWGKSATAALVWIIIPIVVGIWRHLRTEVK